MASRNCKFKLNGVVSLLVLPKHDVQWKEYPKIPPKAPTPMHAVDLL